MAVTAGAAQRRRCLCAAATCQAVGNTRHQHPRQRAVDTHLQRQGAAGSSAGQIKGDSGSTEEPLSIGSLLPAPPAGFSVDNRGNVTHMAPASSRIVTLVDDLTGCSLECNVRRTFLSSEGMRCFVLSPLDTPIQIFRIDHQRGVLAEVTDEEMEAVLAQASYELAKKTLHLVLTGYTLTARGALCFSPEAIINLHDEYGLQADGKGREGVEICYFYHGKDEYTVFTPFDPIIFVAYWDEAGCLRVAEDDALISDPQTMLALQTEEEFTNQAEEEEAVMMALRGIDT